MEQMKELEELIELLNTKQYTKLRQYLAELNEADIASLMEEMEEEDMLKVFRILPKDLAADVFSYLDVDNQQLIITSLSDREAANIINNLTAMQANMQNCCCETQRAIDGVNYNLASQSAAIQANDTANTQKILDAITQNRMADMQNQINALQLQNAVCGVVRYPMATTYTSGSNPFCGCGCSSI